jgi:hypothetical protein
MLPVRLRPFWLLSSMRSLAALTWIAALLPGAALASSTYPRVTAQSDLCEVVGILKGDRMIGAIVLAQAVNVCTRRSVGVAASFEHVA